MLNRNERAVERVLETARRKLLETGTRNRLIHVNRANQRANCLNIINEVSDEIYGILRGQGKRMRFKAMGKDRKADGDEMQLAIPDEDLEAGDSRHTDLFLETPLGQEALARRLLRMFHAARTAEEEQGLNILFLAIGFLSWKESPQSDVAREAPLILLPVELVRNERSSTFDVRVRDEEVTTNLPLQERLRQDFGIVLPEIEEQEAWSPTRYLAEVDEAVSSKPGWSVDRDGMQLGFFSFAKLLMHRDLDAANWPDGAFAENEILAGLLAEGFESDDPIFGPQDKLDDVLDPAEIIQVIDADASQTKVIEEVRRGANLVVQGPPGTGKSQTITNIIAAAAHDGKSVLFVAEKMAALSVVHDRLVKTGLRDICLELHSRTANKKALSQELGRTLTASAHRVPPVPSPEKLRLARDELNRIVSLLHEPLAPSGISPFRAMAEIVGFMGEGVRPPSMSTLGLEALTKEKRVSALAAIDRLVVALAEAGDPESHPFRGVMGLDLQPTDIARLERELSVAEDALNDLLEAGNAAAHRLRLKAPQTIEEFCQLETALTLISSAPADATSSVTALFPGAGEPRMLEALTAGNDWAEFRESIQGKFAPSAWGASLSEVRAGIMQGQGSFLSRLFGPYRRASAGLAGLLSVALPKAPAARLALVDELAKVQELRRQLADEEVWLQAALGAEWRGERTPFGQLLAVYRWLSELVKSGAFRDADQVGSALSAISDPEQAKVELRELAEDAKTKTAAVVARLRFDIAKASLAETFDGCPLGALRATLCQMREDLPRYAEWVALSQAIGNAQENGAGAIVEELGAKRIEPAQAKAEFSYAWAEAIWNAARKARPELNRLPSVDRHALVGLFRELEKERVDNTRHIILSRHFEQMPKGTMGEMGVIRGEIGRKRGHKPVRWLMKNAGAMVQRIKPVMLMSPISVAQFLPAGSLTFDLLVIDEASQIRPEDALGVIARASQIVVVGDQKQLPPTSFFHRLVDDVDDDEDEEEPALIGASAADMESILSLCDARGLRSRMLEWHYRSRDPSLIRVSNAEFYEDNLVLPPSPLQLDENYGLRFRCVPGVYARGGSGLGRQGTNRIEAEAVVKAVAQHARDWPELSLGVVTFSKAQADMMTEVLEIERRRDLVLDSFLREGRQEDVFVKNIENVQGDERDVIMISVGYGPQESNGRLTSMSFGPVNGEGGERRLNVLFSRARVRCDVFASFDPGQIDPSRSAREGPRVLKRFLEFANSGVIAERSATGLEADSPFEEDVARVVADLGFLADPQVGTEGFRIDIGVRHPDRPGQYLLAVECDGATYHSALWARERDRLRQDVLENLGWSFHRIWSTDWFHRREHEIEKLRKALHQARERVGAGHRVSGANTGVPAAIATNAAVEEETVIEIAHLDLKMPAYERAEIALHTSLEPHEAPISQLADLAARIVHIEGPIHLDELARRVSAAFGKSRTGNRILDASRRAVGHAISSGKDIRRSGQFLLTSAQESSPPVRDRTSEEGGTLKANYLPPMEIKAAADKITQESGTLESEEMVRAVARLLGFQRVGPELSAAIRRSI